MLNELSSPVGHMRRTVKVLYSPVGNSWSCDDNLFGPFGGGIPPRIVAVRLPPPSSDSPASDFMHSLRRPVSSIVTRSMGKESSVVCVLRGAECFSAGFVRELFVRVGGRVLRKTSGCEGGAEVG